MSDEPDPVVERRIAERWSPEPSRAHRLRTLGAVAEALAREGRARGAIGPRLAWAACWFLVLANAIVASESASPRHSVGARAVAAADRADFARAFPELEPPEVERVLRLLHASRRIGPGACAAMSAQTIFTNPGRVER